MSPRARLPLLVLLALVGLAIAVAATQPTRVVAEVAAPPEPTPAQPEPIPADAFVGADAPPLVETQRVIAEGDTITALLDSLGLPASDILGAARAAKLDLDHIRAGRVLTLWRRTATDRIALIAYPLDGDGDRQIVVEDQGENGWYAFTQDAAYESQPTVRTFTVSTSLWEQALAAGLRPDDILAIAKLFEYEIDFNTEVYPGMRTEIVTEELSADGDYKKLGAIQAVRLTNPTGGGKTKEYVAIRYETKDGTVGYYAPDGKARKKAFLRSPLEFSRVTSGFSKSRYHPILKTSRAHNGVDLGAPTGTPVRAVADGVVEFAGRAGGHGNHVKLAHEGPYETGYSHLSKILVHQGEHVHQGQLVGLVGMTGLATGPHLHYEFFVHGKYVDPMKVDLPLTEELKTAELPAFYAVRDALLERLNAATEEARGASSLPSSPG
jgi:murein DD-endopeptidase MepM/ murein hydrolase activator NlpD